MKNPPFVNYKKTPEGETRTEFATTHEQLDAHIAEIKKRGYVLVRVHRPPAPKTPW